MQIFCDLDGTLIDVSDRHHTVYFELVKKYSGTPLRKEVYWGLKRKKTAWMQIFLKSGIPKEVHEQFLADFISRIESPEYLKMDTLFPGVKETLQNLKSVHRCYLVSLRRNPKNLLEQTKWLEIDQYFSQIISGHSEKDGYDIKINIIRDIIGSDRGLIIGDTEADVITGKKLGLQTAAVLSGIRDEPFLTALNPDFILTSFTRIRDVIPE